MINHLKDYDKITSPNAKMVALRAQQRAIEEEIQNLYSRNYRCRTCGYLMPIEVYKEKVHIHNPDPNVEYDRYMEMCICPCCGNMM